MLAIIIEGKSPIIRSNKSDLVFNLLRAYFGKKVDKFKLEDILEKFNKGVLKKSQKHKIESITLNINPLEYSEDGATFEISFSGKMNLKKFLEEAFILQGFREQISEHYKLDKIKRLIFSTEVRLHVASFDETKIKKSNLRDIKEVAMKYYDI